MKKIFTLAIAFLSLYSVASAAEAKRESLVCNDILAAKNTYQNIYEMLLERLQNEIVNTGKFDVIDNKRLLEVTRELEKIEDELTDEMLNQNIRVGDYSAHGSILSMNVRSEDIPATNSTEPLKKYIGKMELTIRFQNMSTGVIDTSKKITGVATKAFRKKDIETDKTRMSRYSRIIEPAETKDVFAGWSDTHQRLYDKITIAPPKCQVLEVPPEEDEVYQLCMDDAIKKIVEALMEYRFPINVNQVSGGKVYISLPEERAPDKMMEGAEFEVLELGEEIIDFDTGESLGAEEECVMTIKIDTKRPKMAICVPVTGKENLPKVEEKIKQFIKERSAEKNPVKQKQMRPPFQVRLIAGNKAPTTPEPKPQVPRPGRPGRGD